MLWSDGVGKVAQSAGRAGRQRRRGEGERGKRVRGHAGGRGLVRRPRCARLLPSAPRDSEERSADQGRTCALAADSGSFSRHFLRLRSAPLNTKRYRLTLKILVQLTQRWLGRCFSLLHRAASACLLALSRGRPCGRRLLRRILLLQLMGVIRRPSSCAQDAAGGRREQLASCIIASQGCRALPRSRRTTAWLWSSWQPSWSSAAPAVDDSRPQSGSSGSATSTIFGSTLDSLSTATDGLYQGLPLAASQRLEVRQRIPARLCWATPATSCGRHR